MLFILQLVTFMWEEMITLDWFWFRGKIRDGGIKDMLEDVRSVGYWYLFTTSKQCWRETRTVFLIHKR